MNPAGSPLKRPLGNTLQRDSIILTRKPLPKVETETVPGQEYLDSYLGNQERLRREEETTRDNLAIFDSWTEEDKTLLERYLRDREFDWIHMLAFPSDHFGRTANDNALELFERMGVSQVRNVANSVERDRNAKGSAQLEEDIRELIRKGGPMAALANAATLLDIPLGSVMSLLGIVYEMSNRTGAYRSLDPNNKGNAFHQFSDAVRSETNRKLTENLGPGKFAAQAVINGVYGALDNMVTTGLAGGLDPLARAYSAANQFSRSFWEASSAGATPGEAAAIAAGSMLPDALSPKFKNLIGNTRSTAMDGITEQQWVNFLKQMGIQVGEVNAETAWNRTLYNTVMGENSPENQRIGELMYRGMTLEEAQAQVNAERRQQHLNVTGNAIISGATGTALSTGVGALNYLWEQARQNYITSGRIDIEEQSQYNEYERNPIEAQNGPGQEEYFHKNNSESIPFRPISDTRFDQLTIPARKRGAIIIRGTPEAEDHLRKQNAAASCVGDTIIFSKNVSVSIVLEEMRHLEQAQMGMNGNYPLDLRILLNEIEAREYILENAFTYGVPRVEQESLREELIGLRIQLEERMD